MNVDAKEPTVKLILGTGAVLAAPLFAGATLAGAIGSAAPAPAAVAASAETGGLSLTPAIVERVARAGTAASVTVANTTDHTVRVTLRPRPWLQARDGTVSPDPHRTLKRLVGMSPASFTMSAGSRRTVRLTLRRHAPGGSLYGALDVSGVPRGTRLPNGITPRYRLIGSLRLNPRKPQARVRADALRVSGRGGRQTLVLPLRNLGNTVAPISGRVVLRGPRGERPNVLEPVRVVPRRLIHITLGTYRGLLRGQRPGRYRLSITLSQSGRTVLRTTRTVRLT
jgi:hypothetical protein